MYAESAVYIWTSTRKTIYNTGCPNFYKEFLKTDYLTAIADYRGDRSCPYPFINAYA